MQTNPQLLLSLTKYKNMVRFLLKLLSQFHLKKFHYIKYHHELLMLKEVKAE